MSNPSPLHPVIHEKFRLAFGEPHRQVGKDWHWSLRQFSYIAAVNILINGSSDYPIVWVFDPHDPKDGVVSEAIKEEGQIDSLIKRIEERVKHAGRPPRSGSS